MGGTCLPEKLDAEAAYRRVGELVRQLSVVQG